MRPSRVSGRRRRSAKRSWRISPMVQIIATRSASCLRWAKSWQRRDSPRKRGRLLEQAVALERAGTTRERRRETSPAGLIEGPGVDPARTKLARGRCRGNTSVLGYADPAADRTAHRRLEFRRVRLAWRRPSRRKHPTTEGRALSRATNALGAFKEATALSKRSGPR